MEDSNLIMETLRKLNTIDEIINVLNDCSDEMLEEIRNKCTDVMAIYFGSLTDYDAIYNELTKYVSEEEAAQNVKIIKSVDVVIEQRKDLAAEEKITQGYGR